jgi:hypothetical protein
MDSREAEANLDPTRPGSGAGDAGLQDTVPTGQTFIAYELQKDHGFSLVPAWATRRWMNSTDDHFANRCLPLLMANQAGWFVLNNARVRATWHGARVEFDYGDSSFSLRPTNHFGYGIITWNLPFLFRTSVGYNLLVRGPANYAKDGVVPLEGIVETDWTSATFTINWRFTRVGASVTFEAGEPLCMLVPQRRFELDGFTPCVIPIEADSTINDKYEKWQLSRSEFNQELRIPGSTAAQQRWQKHYFQGKDPGNSSVRAEHQTRMHLESFDRRDETRNDEL